MILEYPRFIFDRTPPFNGELSDLGSSLRNVRDETTLTIDDANQPIHWNIVCAEEAQELLLSYGDGQDTKRLATLEDRNLGDPILRDRTSHDTGYDNGARCKGSLLSFKRDRIRLARWLARRNQSIDELLAVHIRNQNPGISPCWEFTAHLGFEIIEMALAAPRIAQGARHPTVIWLIARRSAAASSPS